MFVRLQLSAMLLCAVALWGWTFVVVKDAVEAWAVLPFLAVRFVIASLCVAPFALWRLRAEVVFPGIAVGLALAIGYLLQTAGLVTTTATNSGLITGLFVVFAPLGSFLLFGVKIRTAFWVAIAVSLLGLMLLCGSDPQALVIGDLFSLGCAVAFGLHIALLDNISKQHDVAGLVFVQLYTAAVVFVILWPLEAPLEPPPPAVWPALVITGVFASAGAFFIQTYVQKRLDVVAASMILVMEPVFAAIFGFALHGDRLSALELAGAVLIFVALIFVELYPQFRRPTPAGLHEEAK